MYPGAATSAPCTCITTSPPAWLKALPAIGVPQGASEEVQSQQTRLVHAIKHTMRALMARGPLRHIVRLRDTARPGNGGRRFIRYEGLNCWPGRGSCWQSSACYTVLTLFTTWVFASALCSRLFVALAFPSALLICCHFVCPVALYVGFALAGPFIETEISPLYGTGECPAGHCVLPVNANIQLQYTGTGALTDAVVSIDVYPKNVTDETGTTIGGGFVSSQIFPIHFYPLLVSLHECHVVFAPALFFLT